MTYVEFENEVLKAIKLFPKGHKFNLREVFGTEQWDKIKKEKLNYGYQFFKNFEDGAFPMLRVISKSPIQGEQLYQKRYVMSISKSSN